MNLSTITAGDSLRFVRALPAHSAAEGWVLHYRLVPRATGGAPIAIQAQPTGTDHQVAVAADTTAAWLPGAYGWAAWVERAGERRTIATGQVTVLPDPRQAQPGADTRSAARRALEDARAALAAWNPTRRRYRIGEREMEFNNTADIIKLITWWEQQVAQEDRQAGRAAPTVRRIHSRL
jgi:hypothetical protein